MPSVEQFALPREKGITLRPDDFPRGLITPPEPVREKIERERAKHPPEVFAKNVERLFNEWTIGYVFDSHCLEVIYRSTPLGPEVLAVGMEETLALRKATPLAEQSGFEVFLGY